MASQPRKWSTERFSIINTTTWVTGASVAGWSRMLADLRRVRPGGRAAARIAGPSAAAAPTAAAPFRTVRRCMADLLGSPVDPQGSFADFSRRTSLRGVNTW